MVKKWEYKAGSTICIVWKKEVISLRKRSDRFKIYNFYRWPPVVHGNGGDHQWTTSLRQWFIGRIALDHRWLPMGYHRVSVSEWIISPTCCKILARYVFLARFFQSIDASQDSCIFLARINSWKNLAGNALTCKTLTRIALPCSRYMFGWILQDMHFSSTRVAFVICREDWRDVQGLKLFLSKKSTMLLAIISMNNTKYPQNAPVNFERKTCLLHPSPFQTKFLASLSEKIRWVFPSGCNNLVKIARLRQNISMLVFVWIMKILESLLGNIQVRGMHCPTTSISGKTYYVFCVLVLQLLLLHQHKAA